MARRLRVSAYGLAIVAACISIGMIVSALSYRKWGAKPLIVMNSVNRSASSRITRQSNLESGVEVLAVVIGSQSCGASTTPGFSGAIARILTELETDATRHGRRFSSVGVALDQSPADGIQFLSTIGSFDEVMVGRSWLNSGAVHYIWRDIAGMPALPQLVLVERSVSVGERSISIGSDKLLARHVGIDQIMSWSKSPSLY